jgi:hypothetical protein
MIITFINYADIFFSITYFVPGKQIILEENHKNLIGVLGWKTMEKGRAGVNRRI